MKKVILIIGTIISFILIALGIYGYIESVNNKTNSNITNNNGGTNTALKLTVDDLKSRIESIKTATNFTSSMNLEVDEENGNASVNLKMNKNTGESETTMTMAGALMMHNYTVLEDGILVSYSQSPIMGSTDWFKAAPSEDSTKYDMDYLNILLENINSLKVENSIFKLTVSKEYGNRLFANENSTEDNTEFVGDILITVNILDNRTNITIDASNAVKSDDKVYTKYIMNISYSNIGTTTIIVPGEVKNSVRVVDGE